MPLDKPPRRRVVLRSRRLGQISAASLALRSAEIVAGTPFEFDMSGLEERGALTPNMRRMFPYFYVHQYPFATDGPADQNRVLFDECQLGDPMGPARYYVRDEINRALEGHVSLTVADVGGGTLTPQADCLLSSIYLDFALEVIGKTRSTVMCRNPNCGKFFHSKRTNQQYCDEQCRWKRNASQKRRRAKLDDQ